MTTFPKQVAKCIRCLRKPRWPIAYHNLRHGLSAMLGVLTLQLLCMTAHAQAIVSLDDQTSSKDISGAATVWVAMGGGAKASELPLPGTPQNALFDNAKANHIYKLNDDGIVWQHYRFAKAAASQQEWLLTFPHPLLDKVTMYQKSASGQWTGFAAGDRLPVSDWPEPGRYAQFLLHLPDTSVHDVYVRIEHRTATSIPVRVISRSSQMQHQQFEYIAVGLIFGVLSLLVITCLLQSHIYHDHAYAWYALYALLLILAIAAWTGIAGHWLWPFSGTWNDIAPGCLGILAGGSFLFVAHQLCGPNLRQQWFDRTLQAISTATIPLLIAYITLPRSIGVQIISVYLILTVILSLIRAWMGWRRKDITSLWILIALLPISMALLPVIANVAGLMPVNWLSSYSLVGGLMFEIPVLLAALNLRTRARHTIEVRAQALLTHDALTGLLSPNIFQDRFQQILNRSRRYNEQAALVYVELTNYKQIKKTEGSAVAEQSLLRSVIKLRRIFCDVETIGRVDEACFGLVFEGISTYAPLTEIATQLISAGLIPLKGLKPQILLKFHVAAVLLRESRGSDIAIAQALTALLASMSSYDNHPIRFLEEGDNKEEPEEDEQQNREPPLSEQQNSVATAINMPSVPC